MEPCPLLTTENGIQSHAQHPHLVQHHCTCDQKNVFGLSGAAAAVTSAATSVANWWRGEEQDDHYLPDRISEKGLYYNNSGYLNKIYHRPVPFNEESCYDFLKHHEKEWTDPNDPTEQPANPKRHGDFFINYLDKDSWGLYRLDERAGYRRIMGDGPKLIRGDQYYGVDAIFKDGRTETFNQRHGTDYEISIDRVHESDYDAMDMDLSMTRLTHNHPNKH